MKASVTVKENYEFRRIYRRGRSAVSPYLVVYCLKGAAADFVGTGVPQLLAVAVVAVSYKLRHSTFLSILLGTGAYMALIQLL